MKKAFKDLKRFNKNNKKHTLKYVRTNKRGFYINNKLNKHPNVI